MGSGIQKKINKSALERIEGLETALRETVEAINKSLTLAGEKLDELSEWLNGVFDVVGRDKVIAAIQASRLAKAASQIAAAKAALEAGIASGNIVETVELGDASLIVGRDLDKDGNEIPPGRSQVLFSALAPEIKEVCRGKGPGFVIQAPNGNSMEILQVFDIIETPPAPDTVAVMDAAVVEPVATPVN